MLLADKALLLADNALSFGKTPGCRS